MNVRKAAQWIIGMVLMIGMTACGSDQIQQIEVLAEPATLSAEPAAMSETQPTSQTAEQLAEAAGYLDSVVRIEIHGSGISHGTVMNGRYLVTHNHFRTLLESGNDNGEFFSLYRANGERLIDHSPLRNLTVVAEDEQTLVFDFGTLGDQGLFDLLGLASAEFSTSKAITVGMQVAQVNWDGAQARIDWVTVQEVRQEYGVNVLVLSNGLLKGASGGGIFWNGVHVANNWSTTRIEGQSSGDLLAAFSTAAVNNTFLQQAYNNPQLANGSNPAAAADWVTTTESEEAVWNKQG